MRIHRSVRKFVYFTPGLLFLLLFLLPRSFGGEAARPLLSLTVAERAKLPDNTRVSLPGRGTIMLGQLREEHRARVARFSGAGAWGKHVADKLPRPTPLAHGGENKTAANAASGSNSHYPEATVGMRKAGGDTQYAEKAGKGTSETKSSGTLVGPSSVAPNPFLVPRQGHSGTPIPVDYQLFCDGAHASACIYLPPKTTLVSSQAPGWEGLQQQIAKIAKGDFDQFFIDVDPLITDQSFCQDWHGVWVDASQVCEFWYFSTQRTAYKPKGSPASAASCEPQTNYQIDPKQGTVTANFSYSGSSITTGATPITCVVQVWMYP